MAVFTHQRARVAHFSSVIILAHRRDVDKQSRRCINPSRVDHIQLVGGRPDHIVGVDFELVGATAFHVGDVEMVFGHVVIFREEMNGRFGNLHVDVVVPREDLGCG